MLYFQQLRPPAKVLQMLEVSVHLIASRFAGYARDMPLTAWSTVHTPGPRATGVVYTCDDRQTPLDILLPLLALSRNVSLAR